MNMCSGAGPRGSRQCRVAYRSVPVVRFRPLPLAVLLVVGAACTDAGEASDGAAGPDSLVSTETSDPGDAAPRRVSTTTAADTVPPPPPRQVSGSVAVVGDSLTVGAHEELQTRAAAHGFTLDINARDGRRTAEGADEVATSAPGHDLVVIALGTNDATGADFSGEAAGVLIDDALAAVDPAVTVLWVNVHRDSGSTAGDAAETFNDALDDAVDRHPNLVPLDWDRWMDDHGDLVSADRLHLTDEGYLARAEWLATAIAEHLPAAG